MSVICVIEEREKTESHLLLLLMRRERKLTHPGHKIRDEWPRSKGEESEQLTLCFQLVKVVRAKAVEVGQLVSLNAKFN